jgi:hypothetical protein
MTTKQRMPRLHAALLGGGIAYLVFVAFVVAYQVLRVSPELAQQLSTLFSRSCS